jgi:hypothetical protein
MLSDSACHALPFTKFLLVGNMAAAGELPFSLQTGHVANDSDEMCILDGPSGIS